MKIRLSFDYFRTASRLNSVAHGLTDIINGQEIEHIKHRNFLWVANLVGEMDSNSFYCKTNEDSKLTIIATRIRPLFYNKIIELKIPFDGTYSEKMYETLNSFGTNKKLSETEMLETQTLFHSMAKTLFINISKNAGYF